MGAMVKRYYSSEERTSYTGADMFFGSQTLISRSDCGGRGASALGLLGGRAVLRC